MSSALSQITERVRERIRSEGVDLDRDPGLAARYVDHEVALYSERALGGSVPMLGDEAGAARRVLDALTGFGALQPLLDDPSVEEIWINAPDAVFIARGGRSSRLPIALSEGEVRDLVERMLRGSGRRVDLSSPFVDASLPDGSRLHVVIPDVTARHWAVNIRKFSRAVRTLSQLRENGSVTDSTAAFLRACVLSGQNILVSGATQAGKTTLLGALLDLVPSDQRIITVEDTFELALGQRDVVAMQGRQPSLEGAGEISLRRLIKEALRMRPDRIVVGEVREAEALDLLIALNSGVPGLCSIHANSARDALVKLATLPLLAGRNIDASFVLPTIAHTVDIVVHCERLANGQRRVAQVIAPTGAVSGAVVEADVIVDTRAGRVEWTGSVPQRRTKFAAAGQDPLTALGRGQL
ncbi:CpaF family protein [Galbitalea soli]|uniref:CpaF family protein n=1 Tax=Galbitalea soli TaxID=1268042 RepID=A0A7C9TQT6_9MICO|nr:ATPase, T2SS/T4P/T4SS family [Galbitalea soli]NEM90543.1 CpaF family protein [Galbitalea soli]NYJ31258.1 pilus assembly protein CpaF [Galbitalea soli]